MQLSDLSKMSRQELAFLLMKAESTKAPKDWIKRVRAAYEIKAKEGKRNALD